MKKLMVIAATSATLLLSANLHAATPINKQLETKLVQVCEALRSDSKLALHRALKSNRLSYKAIAEGLRCNGVDAVTFALQHDASNTADLVARRANIDISDMLAKN